MAAIFTSTAGAATFSDIEYGKVGDLSLRMDGETPAGPGPHPAVILVHGGGWIRGDRVWNVSPLFRPIHDAGFAWFSISYRLATDFFQFGVASQDVRTAIHHIRDNAARYGVDPNRIAILGESAGAHLAALAVLEEPKSVAAMVSLYGPMDLEDLAQTSTIVPAQIRDTLRNSAFGPLLAAHMRTLSPAQHIAPNPPPFLLIHGTSDPVVPISQSTAMQQKLKAAGGTADLITVPGGGHGLRYWSHSNSNWQPQMLAWLRKTLK